MDETISFGNDGSTKISRKGTIKLGSKDAMAEKKFLIETMNHNM